MALSLLTSTGNSSCVKLFEIRLDNSNLILRGNENEAPSVLIKGSVVICLSQPFRISEMRLRLTGESKIGYPLDTDTTTRTLKYIDERAQFLHKAWTFVTSTKTHSEILKPGNYEYPFEYVLPGDSPESVEGLRSAHVIYRLKATIDRGLLAANMYARKHIRVIRTFDTGSPDVANQMTVESVWPNKLDYTISTPTRGVVFGTEIQVDLVLIPLLKGLRIGKITIELIEDDILKAPKTRYSKKEHHIIRTVVRDESEPVEDESVDIEGRGEGYEIRRSIPIPKSLAKCMQSTDTQGIRIKHKVNFIVKLVNPDGHFSELRCSLPVHMFISPNLPLNDDNELVNQGPRITQSDELGLQAPPVYGDHHLDQLYSSVDLSGFMTPAGTSGINTPFTRSRSQSADNLTNMSTSGGEVSASLLQARLNTVQNQNSLRPDRTQTFAPGRTPSGPNTPGRRNYSLAEAALDNEESPEANDYFGVIGPNGEDVLGRRRVGRGEASRGSSSSRPSTRGSRQSSQPPTPTHIERVDIATLSKVPSYGTALQTPARIAINDQLPTYHSVTGQPPTPPPATLRQPSTVQARIRHGR